ncbi:MAG: gamma carbonic anhydrase family protein [Candidatus Altiarchaeum hamiconexum]|uniref:Gamma carbonic anhydrase family protein n=1 Tax=Candidatus Altarchaeum hamiconexum TaxID=1803513 RepID=A0A8J8CFN2_9ARCH|nr:gamma carbonic anhydrase family protein [Candidatus Altarchaeum hamiconexum]OIQ05316.1 MAG: gamma carbonic anhydrase family protein [Candidatus Altarchaeum sp. CG2_30_32_3053]PIN66994.1 MAG: gamma carbonic anhydrase family protein [Candidatus Altarchaeum sp. CG12_big_fil_rev_8_21_14_0_65_33_22]PIV27182.1 MAG: gamma carbonic anhydrase family protein [Candidatus Altarchaeum sp. CG03_land_8_20_14_0_80_32_618]PIX49419.1 MAG: gamma carbonic anhydrase family protein [Candidatus Altarchaeum sp. CG_
MQPKIHKTAVILDGAKIIGDVNVSRNSSVFYNAVVRADRRKITIGKFSNVQDNCIIHAEHNNVIIGDYVSIGHGAIIHGCKISDNCIIGMGAIIMEDAEIKENCIIGAGAIITEGKIIPENSLVYGIPVKVVRNLTKDETDYIKQNALTYTELAKKNNKFRF